MSYGHLVKCRECKHQWMKIDPYKNENGEYIFSRGADSECPQCKSLRDEHEIISTVFLD
jgi:uncharacterized Zn finger protein